VAGREEEGCSSVLMYATNGEVIQESMELHKKSR
jgi:hypothetical protein